LKGRTQIKLEEKTSVRRHPTFSTDRSTRWEVRHLKNGHDRKKALPKLAKKRKGGSKKKITSRRRGA